MSTREATYVGLDIGTTKVACIVGLTQQGSVMPSIIGLGVAPMNGVKRGVVVDLEESVSALTAAIEEAERMSGVSIERASVSVDGAHIQSFNSKGVVAVSRADHEISPDDLIRVEEAAASVALENNRQIIQIIPKFYSVDGQAHVADPVGMNGVRLEGDTHIITASSSAMKNLNNVVFRAGITINSQLIVPLASARAVLNKRQKDLGVALIDIGGETTGIVVYEQGQVSFSTILPIGSNHITKDLVYGLKTNIDVAEKLKCKFATAQRDKIAKSTELDLADFGGTGSISVKELDTIVTARLDELFELVKNELQKANKTSLLGAGVVLTGGGAKLNNISNYANNYLKLPVVVGAAQNLSGIIDHVGDPFLASAVGLMLSDMELPLPTSRNLSKSVTKVLDRVKGIFKTFLP